MAIESNTLYRLWEVKQQIECFAPPTLQDSRVITLTAEEQTALFKKVLISAVKLCDELAPLKLTEQELVKRNDFQQMIERFKKIDKLGLKKPFLEFAHIVLSEL